MITVIDKTRIIEKRNKNLFWQLDSIINDPRLVKKNNNNQ